MANQDDVRRIALSLPGTREGKDHFAFKNALRWRDARHLDRSDLGWGRPIIGHRPHWTNTVALGKS